MKQILKVGLINCLCGVLLPAAALAQEVTTDKAFTPPHDTVMITHRESFITKYANRYRDDSVKEAKKGFFIKPGVTLGVGYRIQRSKTGYEPFDQEHAFTVNYAFNRGAFFLEYKSLFANAIGNWNLGLLARTHFPNVVNFFGVGNNTVWDGTNRRYYRLRTQELYGGVSINRWVNTVHFFEFRPFYQSVKINLDSDRIINDNKILMDHAVDQRDHFAGLEARYAYQNKNHPIIPTKGFEFDASATHTLNLTSSNHNFTRYASSASAFIPLSGTLTFATRVGGTTLQGSPQFYQLSTLGGNENLRGFRRQRFYGETSFYNNNELRWLVNTDNKFFKGKVGLLAFMDQGRVWQPGEKSDAWHVGYGGGLLVVPFKRIVLNGSYGISKEDKVLHFRIGFLF